MEPLITFFGSIVNRVAITKALNAIWDEANSRLNPEEMVSILQQAELDADASQLGSELFPRIDRTGANGYQRFLKFFKSVEVLTELQKPLNDCGKPDVDILVEAFKRLVLEHPDIDNCLSDLMPLWMTAFVESYFEQVKGSRFKVAKAQSLKQLARRVDDVKFVGIAVSDSDIEQPEFLAQIFVMPDVQEERSKKIDNRFDPVIQTLSISLHDSEALANEYQELIQRNVLMEEQKAWVKRDRSAPRIPAQKVINLAQKKAVVLGAPGSGTTMLASYFALMLCGTAQRDPTQIGLKAEDDYLPVVVRIRDWILQPNMGLLEYLRSNAEASLACKELPTGFFEHWLERGRALILLDGLDEVVDEAQRRKVAEQIETFLHQYQDNPAVITSRPAGYRWDFFNLDEFPHYTLESFDDKQVATFIDHWYDSRLKDDKEQADRRKADLQKAFARNERIRLLATNPLLLTIITLIHRYQAELPRQRCKLYEKAVETLLTSWDSGKEIKLYSQVLLFLKSDDLLYILKKLAYWIHTQGSTSETEGGTLIDKDELIRWLWREIQTLKKCEAHEAKGEAERFIDFIQRRTGLLNEQGRDRYAFVHKTFQEYLTAEEIFDRADIEDDTEIILVHFRQHLHDQHWREVLLLLVSKLKGKKAQKAIQAVLGAKSEYEQWLQRDLLFAGWCLTEDPPELTVVAANWVGEILDRLVGLEVSDSIRIGRKIGDEVEKILHCFGETTVEKMVWAKLQAREDRIEPFRLREFQVSLGQEVEVIDLLMPLLGDDDSYMRFCAAELLFRLGNATPGIVNCLFSLLSNDDLYVQLRIEGVLARLGNSNQDVVGYLLSLLESNDLLLLCRAASTLGQLTNPNPEVISGLLFLLDHEKSHVQLSAATALSQLDNTNLDVIDSLLSLLKDKESQVRSSAAAELGGLGHTSSDVVSSLLSLLGDKEQYVRSSAVAALGKLGNTSLDVIDRLLSMLGDKEQYVRSHVLAALIRLGNTSSDLVNSLLLLLEDKEKYVRYHAATVLGDLGNTSSDVAVVLMSLLDDQEPIVRSGASIALNKLAKTSDTMRPEVVQWLEQNPNSDGIGDAIDCLWSIVVE